MQQLEERCLRGRRLRFPQHSFVGGRVDPVQGLQAVWKKREDCPNLLDGLTSLVHPNCEALKKARTKLRSSLFLFS